MTLRSSSSQTPPFQLWFFLGLGFVVLFLSLLLLDSCHFIAPIDEFDTNHRIQTNPPELVSLPQIQNSKRFSFLYISDFQVDDRLRADLRTPALKPLQRYLQTHPVDFLVMGGDNTERGTPIEYEYIHNEILALGLPVFWSIGNHDLLNNGWNQWQQRYGTSIRLLRVGQTSIYLLDNASGTIGVRQRKWLQTQLQQDNAIHKIVTMHFPLYSGNHYELDGQAHMREAQTLSALFRKHRVRFVLAGHSHIYRDVVTDGIRHITISALKENSQNKTFVRIDVRDKQVQATPLPLHVKGYLE